MKDPADNVTMHIDFTESDIDYDNRVNYDYDYEDFARECYLFNELSGQAHQFDIVSLRNQTDLIQEELNETIDAIDSGSDVETLDGCIDILVTAIGLAQKLENAGVNVTEAMKRVATNNLTKYHATLEAAEITQQHYKDKAIQTYITRHDSGIYVVKRSGFDKVMKPVGYVSVDLSDLI